MSFFLGLAFKNNNPGHSKSPLTYEKNIFTTKKWFKYFKRWHFMEGNLIVLPSK